MNFKLLLNLVHYTVLYVIGFGTIMVLLGFQTPTVELSERIFYVQYDGDASNLWMLDPNNVDQPEQLTFYTSSQRILFYEPSADGHLIAYVSWDSNNSENDKLLVLNVDTQMSTEIRSCSQVGASCYSFALSPSGDFLVYYFGLFPDAHEVRMIDLNATTYEEITIYQFDQTEYWYTPDLSTIGHSNVFTIELSGAPYEFQLYDADHRQQLETLPLGTPNRRPIFSADGSRYAYYQSETDMEPSIIEVRQTDSPTGVLSRYRDWDYDLTSQGWAGGVIQDWHPDNEHLLISVRQYGSCDESVRIFSRLHVFNTTTDHTEVLPFSDDVGWANWSPDGTRITYSRLVSDCNAQDTEYELVIYDMQSQTSTHTSINGLNPQWVGGMFQ